MTFFAALLCLSYRLCGLVKGFRNMGSVQRVSRIRWALGLWLLVSASLTQAAMDTQLKTTDIAAQIDGVAFHQKSVELLYALAQQGKQPSPPRLFMMSLIDDYLLARHGENVLGKAYLMSDSRVGYPTSVYLEAQLASTYRMLFPKTLEDSLTHHLGVAGKDVLSWQSLNRDALVSMLDQTTQVEAGMNAEQRALASSYVLASYQFPGDQKKQIYLADLYDRQNVQGKIRFQKADADYIKAMGDQYVRTQAIFWWAQQHSGLSETVQTELARSVEDRYLARKVREHYGIGRDMHDDNPALEKAYASVTQEQINRYYQAHKQDFLRTEQVLARHLLLENESDAKQAHKALISGMSFSEAIAKFSVAPDKSTNPEGVLPWVTISDKTRAWLKSVLFALKPGKISRPIRAPQEDGSVKWQIFFVDEARQGYYNPESETVRYLAGKAVAMELLNAQFDSLRSELMEKSTVSVNPLVVDQLGVLR